MTWWIDRHADGLPIWTGWCTNGRLLRGNDLWSWTRIFQHAHALIYDTLQSDSKKLLYQRCKKSLTLLSVVLSLVNVKTIYGWSGKSFTSFLQLVHNMLPDENTLPKSYYQAKKTLCPMSMEYQKIHACPNDCILYKHEFEEMSKCPRCRVSRYKVKDDEECSSDENSNNGWPPSEGVVVSTDRSKV